MLPVSKIAGTPPQWSEWYHEMEDQFSATEREFSDPIERIRRSLVIGETTVEKLKSQISSYIFRSAAEEIYFFKYVKPAYYSRLIYFQKLFHIETGRPAGNTTLWEPLLQQVLERIQYFFEANIEFYRYYQSGDTYLDEPCFRRGRGEMLLKPDDYYFSSDPSFSTSHDGLVARILASENLYLYASKCLNEIRSGERAQNPLDKGGTLNWTASKASLIELLYAVQSVGAFNNGTSDLKHLARFFEQAFHIELGNYYQVFQEIRLRKKNRTAFLDQLKERLVKRMDEADERGL